MAEPSSGPIYWASGLALAFAAAVFALRELRPHPAPLGPPEVGRTASAIAANPAGAFASQLKAVGAARDPRRAAIFQSFAAALPAPLVALKPNHLLLYCYPGALPTDSDLKGGPWHLILEREGGLNLRPSAEAGEPGGYAEQPKSPGVQSIHIAIPHCEAWPPARKQMFEDLLAYCAERFGIGPNARALASDLPAARKDLCPSPRAKRALPETDR